MEVRTPQVPVKRYERALQPYERLEEEWATFNELPVEGMVVCSSGSAALHLALEAFGLPPGSNVLVPDYTMVACARAVTLAGLTPVFVDCRDDLLMDPRLLETLVGDRPDATDGRVGAVMAVHVYGRQAPLTSYMDACVRQAPFFVEDLAEAHGVRPHAFTDAACWSFYRNKVVAGEEGGAVWFKNPEHARLARCLRSMGFTDAHDYSHVPRGWNYRLSNAHAQLISESLLAYTNNVCLRRRLEAMYDRHCPDAWRMPARVCPWTWDLRIPGLVRGKQALIVAALNQIGVAARMGFFPMSLQQEYKTCRLVGSGKATKAADEVFYLPLSPGMPLGTAEGVVQIFDTIQQELVK